MNGPGFLAVAVQPGATTDAKALDDWYNNEHGPLRLRLPFIETGDRYRATDGHQPEWWAVYDVSDLSQLTKRIYTRLREERSVREKAVMATLAALDRKIYRTASTYGTSDGPAPVMIASSMRFDAADASEIHRWLGDEHVDMMSRVPGWLRTRLFDLVDPSGQAEILALHEFQIQNGIGGPEQQASAATDRMNRLRTKLTSFTSRTWSHYHTFDALDEPPSAVLTTDGAELRFQLEGNPQDPVVVCVNSIMTTLHIWDDVTKALLAGVNGKTYRVLRYNSRGYSQQDPKNNPTSFDILADDLEYLLQRTHVEQVHAVIGVSMGGVTAVNFAIRHPTMLRKFVACDCNVASSPANSQAWAERVELADSKGMEALADATVKRWFTPENHESANAKRVFTMVAEANKNGFKQNAQALSNYDLKPRISEIKAPALLIAGEADGKIPDAMQKFDLPNWQFRIIPKAGHLPHLENHAAFLDALKEFL